MWLNINRSRRRETKRAQQNYSIEMIRNSFAGLKTIINALLHSFRQLAEVMTLTIFCLMVFALFALQVSAGAEEED